MKNNAGNNRFITVKGIGSITAQPDLTTITMKLETKTMDYEQTMQRATSEIELVRQALISIGHERQALKTIDFNVNTDYDSQRDAEGNFIRRFTGYKCSHALKLEMDFNMKRLGETLDAISASGASPEFQIAFSVKDKAAVSAELLESAIANAKDKAAILAKAANVQLGDIQRIDYSWGELKLFTDTKYNDMMLSEASASYMDIEPDDIDATDTVTVVWSIG